jgi:DNA modification methylase
LVNLSYDEIQFLVERLQNKETIPDDFKYKLFPIKQAEYELVYAGKMRKEDVLANEDGVFPVPLQVEKIFNEKKHSSERDSWKNIIAFGDNLQFLKTIYENKDPIIKNKVKGKIKLIYIDPPFASESDFKTNTGAKAYADKVKGAEYLEFLRRRLIVAREILDNDGSIYVHLDWKKSHYVKLILDEIFGEENFRNEIVWYYEDKFATGGKSLDKNHDIIYHYSKTSKFISNEVRIPKLKKTRRALRKKVNGKTVNVLDENGQKIYVEYTDKVIDDVWQIGRTLTKDENVDYPTQKKEELVERVLLYGSNPGDLVCDFFAGSGTLAAVAEKLGRKWIVCDIGKLAFYTMQKRILTLQDSRDLLNKKKKYGKKANPFITVNTGIYDLEKVFELKKEEYINFVMNLFEVDRLEKKINGIKIDGEKKDGYYCLIYPYWKFKNAEVNEEYLEDLHSHIGDKIGERLYIIVPANYVNFITDYHEIDNVRYYFLKVPYQIIKELHKVNFRKLRQPQSKKNINDLENAVGFHFIRQPITESKLMIDENKIKIIIKKFFSNYVEEETNKDMVLPLTQFDAAILTANNGRIIATVCHKVENSGANQSLAR